MDGTSHRPYHNRKATEAPQNRPGIRSAKGTQILDPRSQVTMSIAVHEASGREAIPSLLARSDVG
jgi:hypothetical protein